MKKPIVIICALWLGSTGVTTAALSPELGEVRAEWAKIKYQLPEKQRAAAFQVLAQRANKISESTPETAEPLIWEAIILASTAGETGGLGALSLVKRARNLLLEAEAIDPDAMEGSVYTSLGSLYYQVPGWPLGFGSDKTARMYLEKALSLNPDGIDPNYFYGDFLLDQGNYAAAARSFEKALQALPRAERPLADEGRRKEAKLGLEKAREKL